ncbi:MAG: hypothetical protein VX640_06545 [Pseudomonadota bacterium]|nr:hypothetical protein [Pseudomonadota bacterium]
MTSTDMDTYGEGRRSGGLFWFWVPLVLILFVGGALSLGAYASGNGLNAAESLAAGFGGLAAIIVGLLTAAIGVVIALLGALFGLVAAGGAVAMTLFLVASPVLAIILFVLLMRRRKSDCPDPSAH